MGALLQLIISNTEYNKNKNKNKSKSKSESERKSNNKSNNNNNNNNNGFNRCRPKGCKMKEITYKRNSLWNSLASL